jgi:hypothetical protein
LVGFFADQDGCVGLDGAKRPPIAGGVAIMGEEKAIGGVGLEKLGSGGLVEREIL